MEEKLLQQLKEKFGYPFRLNIGCGKQKFPGYLNIDFRETPATDLVRDVRNLDLPPKSSSIIIAWSVLEHISWRETEKILRHWKDILLPGGKLILNVPNLEKMAEDIIASDSVDYQGREDRGGHIIEHLFGGQDYEGNVHLAGWKPDWLEKELKKAGFKVCFIGDGFAKDFGVEPELNLASGLVKGARGWDMLAVAEKPKNLFF